MFEDIYKINKNNNSVIFFNNIPMFEDERKSKNEYKAYKATINECNAEKSKLVKLSKAAIQCLLVLINNVNDHFNITKMCQWMKEDAEIRIMYILYKKNVYLNKKEK